MMRAFLQTRRLAIGGASPIPGAILMAGLLLVAGSAVGSDELTEITLGTSWYAQAEHGGFYQAKATGLYEDYGLDVTIKMGGPQVNGLQLLVARNVDFAMGYGVRNINAVNEGLPVVTVAASFQKDPQVLISHPQVEEFQDLKGRDVLISTSARQTYWPWLKAEYGFTDAMAKPYTFNMAPFLNNKEIVQQGYVSSEPFAIQQGGVDPNVFLLANYGYPNYSATIETRRSMVEDHPEVVEKFVQASMEGWKGYFENPEPGNRLIQEDNPEMSDEQIAYGIEQMQEYGMVMGGEAAESGIGAMTHARWEEIFDFMANADLVPDDLDYQKGYTLQFLPDPPVRPDS